MKKASDPSSFFPIDMDWEALAALSKLIRFDPASESLTVQNGKSKLVLEKDGTIWVEGKRLVQNVTEDIYLKGATIHLN
ncbi:hypothetical protein HGP17_24875 [Rhizobium sp. P38BS-XIX]|uniref:hypothetical protein n=1 Tax=Rhizobium sp. P38BS-XIX TaxID=2726740 RepID=UPI0014563EB5|nr:hypothetical protein [Rhizobium sp. P38BS-XIX]NLS00072.1 hypothetical protein [Rhizobium sp. P38BS-XIX]